MSLLRPCNSTMIDQVDNMFLLNTVSDGGGTSEKPRIGKADRYGRSVFRAPYKISGRFMLPQFQLKVTQDEIHHMILDFVFRKWAGYVQDGDQNHEMANVPIDVL